MLRIKNIGILIDRTPDASLDLASSIATRCGATIKVFSLANPPPPVIGPPDAIAFNASRVAPVKYLADREARLVELVKNVSADTQIHVREGEMERCFLDFLEMEKIDLALMSHENVGWWSRLSHSDITGQVTRSTQTPVLALGKSEGVKHAAESGIRRVLVATTCLEDIYAAVAYARLLAEPGVELIFAAAGDADLDLDSCLAKVVFPAFIKQKSVTIAGSLVPELVALARTLPADAFFVGSRPHRDIVDRLFGTTADKLLGIADELPVLVIPRPVRTQVKATMQLDEALASSMPASDPLPAL